MGAPSTPSVELDQLVCAWKRALARQELSPSTIESYGWALNNFLRFLEGRNICAPADLNRELVEEWQDELRVHLSRRSRSMASVAVRQFLRWGVGRQVIDPHAPYWVTRVRGARGKPRPLPPETLRVVLGHLARRAFVGSLVDLRDRALFLYILSTGGRVSEILQVKRAEVHRAIVVEKGGGDKLLMPPDIVVQALQEYLQERRDSNPWMWVTLDSNHPMRPLSPASVREIWRRQAARLGLPPWTTHQLRHTGASQLYEADIDGLVVAGWLGHKGLHHVPQYTAISARRREQAREALQRLIKDASAIDSPLFQAQTGGGRQLDIFPRRGQSV